MARRIHDMGPRAVIITGGHAVPDGDVVDVLFDGHTVHEFTTARVASPGTHGTGCTYSAAITAGLATGLTLEDAIRRAKQFVTASIAQRFRWTSNLETILTRSIIRLRPRAHSK